jgi:CubicO group peptidase (beta-lactamase class C family)
VLDSGFTAVADAFAVNFDEGAETGACFAVVKDSDLVVNIRGGHPDKAQETPWTEDTLACVYSTGKAVLSLLVAIEVSNGRLDYNAPIVQYWPAFAANGKEGITVAQALSHQDGLVALPEDVSPGIYLDWDAVCAKIAEMEPLWAPGTANGYHPQTFGFIVGEILRRATGKTVGETIRDLSEPEDLRIFCGMRPDEMACAAFMPKPPRAPDLGALNEYKKLAFLKPSSTPGKVAREDWMAAEIPASNMHADARSLAKLLHSFVGGTLDGDRHLDPATLEQAFKERIRGDDLVLPFRLSWAAGLMRNINRHFGPNKNALGHAGFGGSCVVVDPENRMTIAYVMNKMSPYLVGDLRAMRLVNAVYACL